MFDVLECATNILFDVLERPGYKKLLDVTAKLLPKPPALEANKAILDKFVIVVPVKAVAFIVPLTSNLELGLCVPIPTFPAMYVRPSLARTPIKHTSLEFSKMNPALLTSYARKRTA